MVERHFIVEVMGSRPILFFHFYFWRLNDYGGHYADPVKFSAPHHLAGHQQDTEKAVARHRGTAGRGSGELERKEQKLKIHLVVDAEMTKAQLMDILKKADVI